MTQRLDASFFQRSTLDVAKELLGQELVFGAFRGVILETEAYRNSDDEASHAHRGLTPRTSVMFGPPGYSYVYFIYGMYHCLNIVTEEEGQAAAVLLRALKLTTPPYTLLDGPGKLCRALGITKAHNQINLTTAEDFYVRPANLVTHYTATPRIGISRAIDKPWRFVAVDMQR